MNQSLEMFQRTPGCITVALTAVSKTIIFVNNQHIITLYSINAISKFISVIILILILRLMFQLVPSVASYDKPGCFSVHRVNGIHFPSHHGKNEEVVSINT